MMMKIGIKTGTMASVIQGTVRPRGACDHARTHVPRTNGCCGGEGCEGKGYKTVRKNVFVMNIIIIIINYYFICNETHLHPKTHTYIQL